MNIDNLTKTFTRFFVPGLILVLVGVLIPVFLVLGVNPKEFKDVLTVGNIAITSVLAGYILDSIRGYRWTFAYFKYIKTAGELKERLQEITGIEDKNPDQHIADLWVHDQGTFDRLLQERAEWVMILETSFSLAISSILSTFFTLWKWNDLTSEKSLLLIVVIALLVISSYISSNNGISRMKSHDRKMEQALRNLHYDVNKPIESTEDKKA